MIISDQEVSWAYLLGPCFQLQNTKGVPLTGGYIEVYIHGTRDKYYCASDFAGTLHPFQIPLDSLGSNIVLASPEQAYDVYVYNRFGSLIMSRYNVIPVNGTSEGGGGTSNISITSSDGTITVTDTLDPETGIKTYDLSVPWASGDASYWHGRGASNQGQLISDTDTHVLAISEHSIDNEGEDITVGSDGKFHLKEGVYFWTVNVDLYSDSISNNTQQIYINSNINRASYKMDMTRDNQHSVSFSGITVATQDDFQEGFTIKTEGQTIRAGIYEVAIHKLNPKVLGTKYDAGYGIVIEDDTISVDPEVIPSVSTVSGMIQEAITSIPEYTAGEYIKIEDNEISVTGLQPAGDYLTQEDLEGYATETYVDNSVSSFVTEETVTTLIQEAITGYEPEPELPLVAGDGITITEYEDRVEIAANVTSIDGYATLNDVAESAITSIQLVTGMIPDVSDFITHDEVNTVSGEIIELTTEIVNNVSGDIIETVNNVSSVLHEEIQNIPEQVQSDWNQTDDTQPDYIQNKPDLDIYATHDEVNNVSSTIIETVNNVSGEIVETVNNVSSVLHEEMIEIGQAATGAIPDVSDFATHEDVFESAVTSIQLVTGMIPDVSDYTTHDEVHESIVSAVEYVTGIIPEAQVQSNWTETDNEDPSYIQNKPNELPLVAGDGITITEDLDHITIAANVTSIDGYATIEEVNNVSSTIIETVNNVSGVLHEEIQNIPEQVQANWDETNTSSKAYIQNKPTIPSIEGLASEAFVTGYVEEAISEIPEYTAGDYINIDNYEINVTGLQPEGDYATHADLIEAVSAVTGIGDYGQFYSTNITGAATMSRTKGTIEVTNDGKIKLKKGQSYHVTVRGVYNQTSTTNVYGDVSYIEYITGQSIHVNVDKTITDSQYFELSYDLYKLSNDSDYYVFLSMNGGTVNDLFIEIHAIGSVGVGGSGGGGGTEYDAGWGIQILNNVISVNPSIIPVVTGFATHDEVFESSVTAIQMVTGLIPEAQVQSDWTETDNTDPAYILNKPSEKSLIAGDGISITVNGSDVIISASVTGTPVVTGYVTDEELQDAVEFVTGLIPDTSDFTTESYVTGYVDNATQDFVTEAQVTALIPEQEEVEFLELTAGQNITIVNGVISVTGIPDVSSLATKAELQDGLELVTGLIPTDYASDEELQDGLELVTGLIPNYTAGNYISIENNEISVTGTEDLTIKNLTAGEGITITESGDNIVISASVTGTPIVTGYVTDEELQDAVEFVTGLIPDTSSFATHAEVNNVSGAIINEIPDVSDFVTEAQVTAMLPEEEEVEFLAVEAGSGINIVQSATGIIISCSVTGGGDSYTAGNGIDITNNEISIDNTVALKTDIPVVTGFATKTELQAATGMIPEYTAGDHISIENNEIAVTGTEDLTLMNLAAGQNISITLDGSTVEIACTGIPDVTNYATHAEVNNVSGAIVNEIPDVSDFVTEAQVTALIPEEEEVDFLSLNGGNCIEITSDVSGNAEIAWHTTAGITDIQMVTALPASPVSSILYIIPEA